MDFRERVVAAVEAGGPVAPPGGGAIPHQALHTVIFRVRRLRETAALRLADERAQAEGNFRASTAPWLLERARAGDFALRGLVAELAESGLKVDYRAVWNFVDGEKLSLKKSWWPASAIAPTSRTAGCSGASINYQLSRPHRA